MLPHLKNFLYIDLFLCMDTSAPQHEWRVADSLQGSVLSFHHVGSRNLIQVIGLGSKCFLLSELSRQPTTVRLFSR